MIDAIKGRVIFNSGGTIDKQDIVTLNELEFNYLND